jgi:hypothetical protein
MRHVLCTFLILCGLSGLTFLLPASAGAVNIFQACGTNGGTNNGAGAGNSDVCKDEAAHGGGNPVITVIKDVLSLLSIVIGLAAIIMLIVGGLKYVLSNGDPSGIKSARDTIIYALVGIVVVIFSESIVAFVLDKLN